ncbi:hypothetical protein AY601_0976 [Pedobacter cryoconitis]|uniref:Beta-lactamase-inhibitor-like PepSY-like domain-containing protein n=1 Tax=Pedobacter cryoconitis TaxID=188932 RepID=A0A127V993_9SPHI|nr:hypothetical protein [Pedobacter cryoconitis]AMP97913.1 hypothetical protein AY601_0976 [Pedobacter cryoconitis]
MKYALTFLLCLFGLFSCAQHFKLNQLESLIGQPVSSVTDSLVQHRWEVRPELSGKQGHQLYKTFSFGNHASEQGKALSWFRIQADNEITNQLYYQVSGAEAYQLILEEIKQTGAEKKDIQEIEAQQISTYYISTDYIFQTIVGNDSYTIMVMPNQ